MKPKPNNSDSLDQVRQMIYDHCHSVQGPLNVIEGIAWYVIRQNPPSNIASELQRIAEIANHLRSRTSALALIANIDNGSLARTSLQQIDCKHIFNCTLEVVNQHLKLGGESNKIRCEITGEESACLGTQCLADHRVIRHVIEEVIQNSFQYSKRPGITRVKFAVAGKYLKIEFKTQGVIMTHEDAKHACERGWHSKEAQLCLADGKGLGLWTATAACSVIGAKIKITPTNRAGTTAVTVFLPISHNCTK